jgi:hypothetical protein
LLEIPNQGLRTRSKPCESALPKTKVLLGESMIYSSKHRFISACRVMIFTAVLALAACSGEVPVEKAIIGTWIQGTPMSMTSGGVQTTTTDTILTLKKTGEGTLSRVLNLQSAGLPPEGVNLNVDLRGRWELKDGQLIQTVDTTLITARTPDALSVKWADELQKQELQKQAAEPTASVKIIIAADKTQLILQDTDRGITDVYRRK